jgi:hypothetical protein
MTAELGDPILWYVYAVMRHLPLYLTFRTTPTTTPNTRAFFT